MRNGLFALVLVAVVWGGAGQAFGRWIGDLGLDVTKDGGIELINCSDSPVHFDGFEIQSAAGLLDPSGYCGIVARSDPVTGDRDFVVSRLGPGALDFVQVASSSVSIAEISLGSSAVMPIGGSFPLGSAFLNFNVEDVIINYLVAGATQSDVSFWFTQPTEDPPVAIAGGPYLLDLTIVDSITLDATASMNATSGCRWELGSGVVFGRSPTITWTELQEFGLGLGEHSITLEALGQYASDTDVATLTIIPEPATLALLACGAVVIGKRRKP